MRKVFLLMVLMLAGVVAVAMPVLADGIGSGP